MTVNRSDEDPVFAARPRNVQHYRAAREPDSFAPGVNADVGGMFSFLAARLAEDEQRAMRAAFGWGTEWRAEAADAEDWHVVHASGQTDMVGCEDEDVIEHIAAMDPGRLLAEVAAKRGMIENAERIPPGHSGFGASRFAVRCLASIYAAHPDFRREWLP